MLSDINPISFASLLLSQCVIDKTKPDSLLVLAKATGFIYKRDNKQYLITNLHVVSGRNMYTGKIENPEGAVPEFIKADVSVYDNVGTMRKSGELQLNLYDANQIPLWLIHPQYKRQIDIAVIQLNLNNKINLWAINDMAQVSTYVSVADEIFVVGYPLSLGANENKDFPIWKNATIASEPSVNYFADGRKAFVIDGTTRSGMSGSPVIRYTHFTYNKDSQGISFGMSPQCVYNFLGIYSGRLISNDVNNTNMEHESFLGLVWKKELIDEIIDGNIRDEIYE